ncbi:MerR family DNA-binding transcriptional regulator [Brevibacillus choshinensis]|uniref:MerR family DNA-binding transcriptional regulator n=1 Tax=Brevibacillus choshinensis TaxID=54911 RepID=UPI002E1A3674|nr:MerR family DNA-binding transcriptional regulator [Brevibacillus choshinensis]MED4752804.1 MerR family DNA-binding transcriptional regulator [Brevibacillus choshinensis]
MNRTLRPSDIAKQLGISTSSLRNYEARGIVPPAGRAPNGYRVYTYEHAAYFECIVAMSPGFGMEITSAVLSMLQRRELGAALWMINDAQAATHEDKLVLEKAVELLEQIVSDKGGNANWMTIGEMSAAASIPASTLRYWEDKGLISSTRNETNNYRLYDKFQAVKVWLLKSTQKTVYSGDTVRLKQSIGKLPSGDLQALQSLIELARNALLQRNREQLRGLHSLYRLCTVLTL